jgi:hypothetical protein
LFNVHVLNIQKLKNTMYIILYIQQWRSSDSGVTAVTWQCHRPFDLWPWISNITDEAHLWI